MSDYDDNKIEAFYDQLQNVIDQTPKQDILVVQETGMKWARMFVETGKAFVNPSAMMTESREDWLLEFATFNDLVLANTFGHPKASRRRTWHSPNRQHHCQTDYSLVRKRFQSGVNSARTRKFPRADIGSDYDLLMMTFLLRLIKNEQAKTHKTQVWPRKAERSQCVGSLPSYDRREVVPLTIMNNLLSVTLKGKKLRRAYLIFIWPCCLPWTVLQALIAYLLLFYFSLSLSNISAPRAHCFGAFFKHHSSLHHRYHHRYHQNYFTPPFAFFLPGL